MSAFFISSWLTPTLSKTFKSREKKVTEKISDAKFNALVQNPFINFNVCLRDYNVSNILVSYLSK